MKRVDEAQLTDFLAKREEKDSRILNPAFEGRITGIKGTTGSYQIQVVKLGEATSDGHWYPVQGNGQVPVIGDRVQLQWQNDQIATVTSILNTPRVADAHNVVCNLYWTGSATLAIGWNPITFNTIDYDPLGMSSGGTVTLPLSGNYLVVGRAGTTTQNVDVAVGLYLVGALFRQGTRSTTGTAGTQGDGESLVALARHFTAGNQIVLYLFSSASAALQSGSAVCWLDVYLLGQSSA